MCTDDYEVAKLYSERIIKSKKNHICCECSRKIKSGERYRYVFVVDDSVKPCVFKTCHNCIVPQDWIREKCGGFAHTRLHEEVIEHAMEYRKIFLYKWAIKIKNKWEKLRKNNIYLDLDKDIKYFKL